jgi:ferredoxin/flavodoxin---NADP+ reductase
MNVAELNAVMTEKEEVAPGLLIIRVEAKGWEMPSFVPGQFAVLGLPGKATRHPLADPEDRPPNPETLIRRAYSIASSSLSCRHMEFYLTMVRSGALTPRLFALDVGDPLWLGQRVSGLFTLGDVPAGANVVLVATGTGLAPYMSMLRTFLASDGERRFAVLHGSRHSWDLGYRSELLALESSFANLTYIPIVSRPQGETEPWPGEVGYVQDLWNGDRLRQAWGRDPSPDDTHVFLCGNPTMAENMLELLARQGYAEHTRKQPGQVHVERYW